MLCESSANSSQALYIPQVKNDLIPKINQEFDSLQKVKEFYNRYAKEAETFEWLFKEWLKAMPASPPKMIITDQDLAMTKAIASALPNTLHRMQIEDLPNEYILRRWTKSAKAMRVRDDLGPGMKEICDKSLLERRNRLFKLASTLIDEAMITEDGTEFVEEHLSLGHKNLCDMKKLSQDGERSAIQVPIIRDLGLKEPLQVRAKGCGKRLKGGKEKVAKKAKHCHGCGLTGQSHDKKNCPKLLSSNVFNICNVNLIISLFAI
ncbi:hypothetical protein RHSIM_Rhsim02G0126800 [Rhododendron simsii]|uniref:Protein FAR1-RELATED SEQUENCE n=1 Tax=Rhododendron simsii TaxID=118357 RepID=A0A834HCA2_RHOSS|nr:hypothetical protein RHSIM_Rhsim02G0126800 [Rhododendron simsii]